MVILTNKSRPGAPTGINQYYYVQSYPVRVIVYGLFAITDKPKIEKLLPIKVPEVINCVVERVIEHFENKKRGNKLTEARRTIIDNGLNRNRMVHE